MKSLLEAGPCVSIKNLAKAFSVPGGRMPVVRPGHVKPPASVVVFENFSFDVSQGEFVVVLGRSGCGKSTLLKMIAGLIAPDQGQILVMSQPVGGPNPWSIMVFQDFALFPWRTALGNVRMPLNAGTWRT